MRPSAALLALAFAFLSAGCVQEAPPAGPDLIRYCPQWQAGATRSETVVLQAAGTGGANETRPQEANATLDGHPLNLFRVVVTRLDLPEGRLEMRAFTKAEHKPLNLYDYRNSGGVAFTSTPVVNLEPGANVTGKEFDTLLTSVLQSDPGTGGPIDLAWSFEGASPGTQATVEYTVTPHYRVCGAAKPA